MYDLNPKKRIIVSSLQPSLLLQISRPGMSIVVLRRCFVASEMITYLSLLASRSLPGLALAAAASPFASACCRSSSSACCRSSSSRHTSLIAQRSGPCGGKPALLDWTPAAKYMSCYIVDPDAPTPTLQPMGGRLGRALAGRSRMLTTSHL